MAKVRVGLSLAACLFVYSTLSVAGPIPITYALAIGAGPPGQLLYSFTINNNPDGPINGVEVDWANGAIPVGQGGPPGWVLSALAANTQTWTAGGAPIPANASLDTFNLIFANNNAPPRATMSVFVCQQQAPAVPSALTCDRIQAFPAHEPGSLALLAIAFAGLFIATANSKADIRSSHVQI